MKFLLLFLTILIAITFVYSNEIQDKINENNIIDIGEAKFYVPNYPIDYIQSVIVNYKTFYENDILEELKSYIKKNSIILDIGANIGNHSIYWAKKTDAKRIYSFEPVHDTFKILKKNIEINGLIDKVKIFNIGLSDEKINGSITNYFPDNIGATQIKQDSNGNLLLDKLDNIKLGEDTIDFIKIDVEGHELYALQGARETLITFKPIIFIEIFEVNQIKVHEFLENLGYRLEKRFDGSNYLYIFEERE